MTLERLFKSTRTTSKGSVQSTLKAVINKTVTEHFSLTKAKRWILWQAVLFLSSYSKFCDLWRIFYLTSYNFTLLAQRYRGSLASIVFYHSLQISAVLNPKDALLSSRTLSNIQMKTYLNGVTSNTVTEY